MCVHVCLTVCVAMYLADTGTLGGVGITVLAIGMGMPMMDFAVREVRAVVEGPMIMVRYGTCGGLRADVRLMFRWRIVAA